MVKDFDGLQSGPSSEPMLKQNGIVPPQVSHGAGLGFDRLDTRSK
jgi:hypothetical protein